MGHHLLESVLEVLRIHLLLSLRRNLVWKGSKVKAAEVTELVLFWQLSLVYQALGGS